MVGARSYCCAKGLSSRPARGSIGQVRIGHSVVVSFFAEAPHGGAHQTSAVALPNVAVHFIPRGDLLTMMNCDVSTGLRVVSC